jgi:hypothetical protein
MKRYKRNKRDSITIKGGGGGRARVVGEVFIGELSSVVLSFFRGRRGERSGKEGGVDGDSGIKVRAVLLSLFSDIIGRDLPSSLLAQLLKL